MVSGGTVALPSLLAWWGLSGIQTDETFVPPSLVGSDIKGPLNLLLFGLDLRRNAGPCALIRSDSIVLVHIPAAHDKVYMISLARDTSELPDGRPLPVPDMEENGFVAWDGLKLTEVFQFGAAERVPQSVCQYYYRRDDSEKGIGRSVQLSMSTINNIVPGGLQWHGAAVINFEGFKKVLEAIGGVRMYVDTEVTSIHYDKNGTNHEGEWGYLAKNLSPAKEQQLRAKGAMVYTVGWHDLTPWQALDYSRQRDYLADGSADYGRQRHQQQLLFAIADKIMSKDVMTNLGTVNKLKSAAGDALTIRLMGAPIEDWVFTLRNIRTDDIIMIKTPPPPGGGCCYPARNWNGERLTEDHIELLKAVHDDTVDQFLMSHPNWISTSGAPPGSGAEASAAAGPGG